MRLAILAAALAAASATIGVDVSTSVDVAAWQCLKKSGHEFAVIRAWQSNGVPDPNSPSTIISAWEGGMAHVDVYLFPCFSCGDAAGQVQKLISFLAAHGITDKNPAPHTFGMLWFDIEGPQYWPGSVASHVDFMSELVNEARALGINHGIYSSPSQWDPIMGGSSAFSAIPLWWPRYDGEPSLTYNWANFGGWTHAAIKQYQGTTGVCGVGVDLNYY